MLRSFISMCSYKPLSGVYFPNMNRIPQSGVDDTKSNIHSNNMDPLKKLLYKENNKVCPNKLLELLINNHSFPYLDSEHAALLRHNISQRKNIEYSIRSTDDIFKLSFKLPKD